MSNKAGPLNIYWEMADGSGGLERLTTSQNIQVPLSWSPNGERLAFIEVSPTTAADIWVCNSTTAKRSPSCRRQRTRAHHSFLLTRRWLAYTSDESGRREIYVQPYSGPGGQVADLCGRRQRAGMEPQWAGAVLSQRGQDDGGGHNHAAKLLGKQTEGAV